MRQETRPPVRQETLPPARQRRCRRCAGSASGDSPGRDTPVMEQAPPAADTDRGSSSRASTGEAGRYRLFTDGGARGNPGPAGIGARLLTPAGDVAEELGAAIGRATNNVAEYRALLAGLEMALDLGVERLDVFLDSELVVRQVNGQYKVKDAGLKPLHAQACLLLSRFHDVQVGHVRREQNAEADRLVNEAIDAATG